MIRIPFGDGKYKDLVIDTGAEIRIMRSSTNSPLLNKDMIISTMSGEKVTSSNMTTETLFFQMGGDSIKISHPFHILDHQAQQNFDGIIGNDFLKKYECYINYRENLLQINPFVQNSTAIIDGLGKVFNEYPPPQNITRQLITTSNSYEEVIPLEKRQEAIPSEVVPTGNAEKNDNSAKRCDLRRPNTNSIIGKLQPAIDGSTLTDFCSSTTNTVYDKDTGVERKSKWEPKSDSASQNGPVIKQKYPEQTRSKPIPSKPPNLMDNLDKIILVSSEEILLESPAKRKTKLNKSLAENKTEVTQIPADNKTKTEETLAEHKTEINKINNKQGKINKSFIILKQRSHQVVKIPFNQVTPSEIVTRKKQIIPGVYLGETLAKPNNGKIKVLLMNTLETVQKINVHTINLVWDEINDFEIVSEEKQQNLVRN